MDKVIKQPYLLDDGRKAEKVVQVNDDAGETKIVTELWEEPKVEKRLMQRVIEYKKPLVYKREVEVLGENGEVVDRQIENLDETVVEPVVAAMSTPVSPVATESPITRAELTEALKTVVSVLRSPTPVQTPEPKISAFSLLESKVEQKKAISESWKWYLIIAAAGSAVGFIVFIL